MVHSHLGKKNIIERIKTILIVVLFLSTILLLYFFWEDIKFDDISLDNLGLYEAEEFYQDIPEETLVKPSHIDICFDNETYAKILKDRENYWDASEDTGILYAFTAAVSSENIFFEEITQAQYDGVMEYVSAKAIFDYFLPFRDFCEFRAVSLPAAADSIGTITEIGFSAGSPESMFIYDGDSEKYFRIASDYSCLSLLENITDMAIESQTNTTYYPLDSYVGETLENRALIPAFLEVDLKSCPVRKNFTQGDEEAVADMAKNFFSGSLDFVRMIEEENGKIIYMYGYGERVLIADVDGTLEYRAEPEKGTSVKYFEALSRALTFISLKGGFITEDGLELTPYIKAAEELKGEARGYRFEFGLSCRGNNVYYDSGNAAEIQVVNGQITYFKGNYINFDENETSDETKEAHSPINVLAQNYQLLYELGDLGSDVEEGKIYLTSEERFNYVTNSISDIDYGYVFLEGSEELKPCYIVVIKDGEAEAYFDIYTAEPLGHRKG